MFSVVIPTFPVPSGWFVPSALFQEQSRPPDEVVAVARNPDLPTHEAIDKLGREPLPFKLRRALVSAPEFSTPPVELGLRAASGDVSCRHG